MLLIRGNTPANHTPYGLRKINYLGTEKIVYYAQTMTHRGNLRYFRILGVLLIFFLLQLHAMYSRYSIYQSGVKK